MKKGIFSLLIALLACVGLANAQQVVEIGTGTSTSSSMPSYSLWCYSYTQELWTADEIGVGGQITSIAFNTTAATASYDRSIVVYMKNVSRSSFASATDWEPVTSSDQVFSGVLPKNGNGWVTLELDTPFAYDGASNLMIAVDDNTGSWSSKYYYYTSASNMAHYAYSDSYNPDPFSPSSFSGSTSLTSIRANIRLTIFTGPGEVVIEPEAIEMMDRPLNNWMRPVEVTVTAENMATTIRNIDITNECANHFFVLPFDVANFEPIALGYNESTTFAISTADGEEGEYAETLAVFYDDNRTAALADIYAYAYTPQTPDTWETAQVIDEFPFTAQVDGVYDNYLLPPTNVEDGFDAVYKFTVNSDMVITGNVEGENGKMALYSEGFMDQNPNSVGYGNGPHYDNYYNGVHGNGGGAADTFVVDFEGGMPSDWNVIDANNDGYTWCLTSAIPTTWTYYSSMSLDWYHNGTNAICSGSYINGAGALNPDEYLVSPQVNIANGSQLSFWVAATDASYPADHFGVCVSANGTSDWTMVQEWTLTAKSGAKSGDAASRDGRGLRLGNWYNYTVDLSAYAGQKYIAFRHFNCYDQYIMCIDDIELTAGRAMAMNRDENALFFEDFEDGVVPRDWTIANNQLSYDWEVLPDAPIGTWYPASIIEDGFDGGAYALWHQGFGDYASTKITTPNINLTGVETANLTFLYLNPNWGGDQNSLYVKVNGNVLFSSTENVANWTEASVSLNEYCGQNINIEFEMYDGYGYFVAIDNVTVNETSNLLNEFVTPGTYYVAASSTDETFTVNINAEAAPCPVIASNPSPADNEDGIDPVGVRLTWKLGQYTSEYRLVFGSTYYCEEVLVDWTSDLAEAYTFAEALYNNTNYFWRVDERNSECETLGEVWGFTTHLNVPTNLRSTSANGTQLYEGDVLNLAWNAIQDRTFRQYNVYMDGELIGSTPVNTTTTTYTVEGLTYNMRGYRFNVTAVYDEGESAFSNTVTVYVSGEGMVDGYVFEQDGTTGIANATVTKTGRDEFNRDRVFSFTTDANGYYSGNLLAGTYNGTATCAGYQDVDYVDNPIEIVYGQLTADINYVMDEVFTPVGEVIAEYYPDPEDPESPYVKVYWSWNVMSAIIEDFESGDFSMFDWNVNGTYPFEITTEHPYEGTYCMRSTNYNVASSTSSIDVTVEIPRDGLMSFYAMISCESSWDMGYFYIDGVQKGSFTGTTNWTNKEYDITAGEHNFKWSYTKDSSVNSGEDRFYIDYIDFIHDPEPAQPGWHTYAPGDFNNAVGSNVGTSRWAYEYPASLAGAYAGFTMTKVALFSDSQYGAVGGNYTCTVYVGGNEPMAGTAVSTITVDVPQYQNAWVEWDLTTPVAITGEPFWVVWTANTHLSSWPAGCCSDDLVDAGTWWSSGLEAGYGWDHATYGTWTMKNYFTNRSGRTMSHTFASSKDNANQAIEVEAPAYAPVKGLSSADAAVVCNPNAQQVAAKSGNDRAFSHFRVYRTDCYNEDYTAENTVVLACELHDTLYIDVEWPDVPAGVYKWGVGCVYAGNRESAITWAEPVNVTREATADYDDNANGEQIANRALWDELGTITCSSAYQYGVASDGTNIYTSAWTASAGFMFAKYDMDGNFIETFNVTGCGYCRDITYDGQYFYGVANSSTVYCLDLANHALVNTFTSGYGAMRCIGYDAQNDGFWVVGNWSGSLSRIDRNGAVQFTGPTPSSASGVACYVDSDNVNHVLLHSQPASNAQIDDYNINTNTLTAGVHSVSTSDISGGIDIHALNGTLVCYASLQSDPNVIHIYDLDTNVGGGGNGGTIQGLQEERESPIVWSNCLDKNMFLGEAEVSVTVLLNSADSPEGVNVKFTNYNEFEQGMYPVAPVTLDETGYYAFDSFRKGEYKVEVSMEGYEPIVDSVSIWNATDLRYVMTEIIYGVSDLYVSQTGWAMWAGNGAIGGGNGGNGGGNGNSFTEGFEGGLNGWTVIDVNAGEGTWLHSSNNPGGYDYTALAHGGAGFAMCYSFVDYVGAYNTDSYLISPCKYDITANSQLTFWADNANDSYPESFSVCVATVDNPSATDFTQVWSGNAKENGGQKAAVRHDDNRYENWRQHTINLGAYAGQAVYIAFHDVNQDMYEIWIDDVELTAGAKSDDRHVECYKVLCTSIDGEPIFSGNTENPFIQVPTEELVAGDTYLCKVATVYSTGMSGWSEIEWTYMPCDNFAGTVNGVEEGDSNDGNTITWSYPNGGGGGGGNGGNGDTFVVDFEGGMPSGWNVIDANNDGYTWCLTSAIPTTWSYYSSSSLDWYHNGTNAICSGSFINGVGALNPDEYLVSPQVNIANGSQLSFWVAAADASYPADHFGVCVSANGTSDWTMVQEWTLTAKSGAKSGDAASRDGHGLRLGNWYNYTVDLSAYAGQKYIAFRHFNCTDQYIMCLDDIELSNGGKSRDAYIQYCTEDYAGGVGTGGGQVWWAVRFPASDLGAYAGQNLSQVGIYVSDDDAYGNNFDGTYNLEVYLGGANAPQTLMTSTSQYIVGDNAWHDIELPEAVAIDGTQDLWMVFMTTGIGHPMSGCNYVGNSDSDWLSLDGVTYEHSYGTYGLAYSWMIRGLVTDGGGQGPQPGGDVLGAMIFRDGEWLAFTTADYYTDVEEYGEHEYCVRMVYDGTAVCPDQNEYYSMSCPECITVGNGAGNCQAGMPIRGEYVWNSGDEFGALISWGEQAMPISEWLYYDNGTLASSIGAGGTIYWGIMIPSASLSAYAGCSLTQVAVCEYNVAGSYTLNVYYGGATPTQGMLVHTQDFSTTGTTDWKEVVLSTPLPLDVTQNLWITFYQSGIDHPATCCNNTGDPNGRWVATDGTDWADVASYNLNYTWMVRGFVTNEAKGGEVVELPSFKGNAGGELSAAGEMNVATSMDFMTRASITKYNVYRSTSNANYSLIGSVDAVAGQDYYEYFDATAAGTYYYQVRAMYDNGCESEPAVSEADSSVDYVIVDVTSVSESGVAALYPNPTSGNITIEAQNMSRVTVVSVLGQVVYDAEVDCSEYTLNMSQFNAGVYMVRIATESGVSTQRVTVVK